jgi:hypothetical protein
MMKFMKCQIPKVLRHDPKTSKYFSDVDTPEDLAITQIAFEYIGLKYTVGVVRTDDRILLRFCFEFQISKEARENIQESIDMLKRELTIKSWAPN